MPPTTTNSGNANEQPALSAGLPPQERVVRGHLPAPTGGGGTNRAKILKQIPEAGHGMAAGCCCQLWAGSRRRGGQLPGCHLPPAAVHGCHSSQADCLPHTRMDGRGRPRQPEVLGGEAPAAELGRQAGCDRSRHWAVPEVVAAVRVRLGCAAAAGLGGRGHAGSDGEGVEHQAPVDFLVCVCVLHGYYPQARNPDSSRNSCWIWNSLSSTDGSTMPPHPRADGPHHSSAETSLPRKPSVPESISSGGFEPTS